MAFTPSPTHNPQRSYIDETRCVSIGTLQYLLERTCPDVPQLTPVRADNRLEVFICGEAAFARIAKDIARLKGGDTIDLICWGFDPAMMLERGEDGWSATESYGHLLEQAARRGARVRLLVWFNAVGSLVQGNTPGHSGMTGAWTDRTSAELSPQSTREPDDSQRRHDHCVLWWRKALGGKMPNLQVRKRDGQSEAIRRSLAAGEQHAPSTEGLLDERLLMEQWGTHHQKTLLINYRAPAGGVGYVMGLNSVSDYWDSAKHLLDDERREAGGPGEKKQGYRRMKPLQDYACRIDGGGVLEHVHANFARAWERAGGAADAHLVRERVAPVGSVQTAEPHEAVQENEREIVRLAARAGAGQAVGSRTARTSRAQILRTQPEEGEKSIKAFYAHSSEVAHDYLYLENQYFFYPEWAQRLREARAHWVSRWQASYRHTPNPEVRDVKAQDMPILHVMVVTPEPEKDPMVPRTYETLRHLGQERAMRTQERDAAGRLVIDPKTGRPREIGQDVLVEEAGNRNIAFDLQMSDYRAKAAEGIVAVQQRPNAPGHSEVVREALRIKPIGTEDLNDECGMKVSVAMLYTSGVLAGAVRYRPIYIHSKLMIHSDGCFTLGSANMNQRSMAGDSEINIASDCPFTTRDLRERVFRQLSGGQIGGGTGQKAAAIAFSDWNDLMHENKDRRNGKKMLKGFLLPFEEGRVCEVRYG